ncbi:MAG: hypothetical protein K2M61_05540 [Muribaculaceae bacterium]|nr:hypothetical protein [Muribaculaceae bacterium]
MRKALLFLTFFLPIHLMGSSGEDRVTFHPNSTVILNGKRITNGQSRARRNQDYDSLTQEGKTFWYAQNDKYNVTTEGVFCRYEYGFRIGKEVELDNLTWHEVVLCRCAYADASGVISRVADSDQLVGYMREDNKQVFVKDIFYNHTVVGWQPGVLGLNEVFYDDVHTYKLYDFNPQAQEVELGNDEAKVKLYLNAVERNNDDRNVYTFRYNSFTNRHGSSFPTDLPLLKPGDEIQLVEGVGYIFTTETSMGLRHLSELFFAPFGCDMTSAWPIEYPYELRYVTDGDGNILYEATGGIKLWEYAPSGVEDVSIDLTKNAQWYTLGGVRIKAPAVPGVYILRIGNKAEKIAIQ